MADIDIAQIAAAIAASRGQSMEQSMSDLDRFAQEALLEASSAADRAPIRWTAATAELGKLPSMKTLAQEISPVRARISTELGCRIYAFSWELIEPNLAWFVGVHCFPGEAVDLDRQQRFVLTAVRGRAMIALGDAYLKMLEQQTQAFVMHVYGVALESAPDIPDA